MDQNLYAGETLKSFLEHKRRLEPSVLLKVMEPVARKLALLHREGQDGGYFPLEACVDRPQIGSRPDVCSLCAVMYEALTGRPVLSIKK